MFGQPGYFPILENIGNAMNLNRIAVFSYDTRDATTVSLTGEWTFEGSAPLTAKPPCREALDPTKFGLAPHMAELKRGSAVTLTIDDFDPAIKDTFASYRFASMAIFAIQVNDEPYGLIFFIDAGERTWPSEELEAMRIATNIIGSAIGLSAKT